MTCGPSKFKQPSFGRLAKGLAKTGQKISRIDFDATTGRYTITVRDGDDAGSETEFTADEWKEFVREKTAKHKTT